MGFYDVCSRARLWAGMYPVCVPLSQKVGGRGCLEADVGEGDPTGSVLIIQSQTCRSLNITHDLTNEVQFMAHKMCIHFSSVGQ